MLLWRAKRLLRKVADAVAIAIFMALVLTAASTYFAAEWFCRRMYR